MKVGGRWWVGGLVGGARKRNVRMGRIGWVGGVYGGVFFFGGGMWCGLYDRRWQSDRAVVGLGDTTRCARF